MNQSISHDPTHTAVVVDLVQTPSISGSERAGVDRFVTHAVAMGLHAEIDAAGNGLAHRGPPLSEAAVHIVLLGHIDTVPGDIPVRVIDGVLFGRGSVDAKGPLAAMLCAAASVDLPSGVALTVAAAVGEETPESPGARHLATQFRPDACIIGEPSGWDGVTLGYKGSATCVMSTEVACAHTAGPDASAADRLLAAWNLVKTEVHRSNQASDRAFEKIQATVRQIKSQTDGLTEHAELLAGFRLPPAVSPTDLRALVERITCRSCTVRWNRADPAYQTDRNDPVVRALSNAIRACGCTPRPKVKTGTADMNVVGPLWQCPIAAYGPGDSSLDHSPNENLQLDEYHRSIQVLRQAIGGLASELLSMRSHPSVSTTTP